MTTKIGGNTSREHCHSFCKFEKSLSQIIYLFCECRSVVFERTSYESHKIYAIALEWSDGEGLVAFKGIYSISIRS